MGIGKGPGTRVGEGQRVGKGQGIGGGSPDGDRGHGLGTGLVRARAGGRRL